MTQTIQKPATRVFLAHAAELYGVELTDARLDELEVIDDDAAAIAAAFPWLDDAERQEALWALGHFVTSSF